MSNGAIINPLFTLDALCNCDNPGMILGHLLHFTLCQSIPVCCSNYDHISRDDAGTGTRSTLCVKVS